MPPFVAVAAVVVAVVGVAAALVFVAVSSVVAVSFPSLLPD